MRPAPSSSSAGCPSRCVPCSSWCACTGSSIFMTRGSRQWAHSSTDRERAGMVSDDQVSEFTANVEQLGGGAAGKPLVRRPTEPCLFVIFGASGDLTGRKLIPALYNLFCQDFLPARFAVVGVAISPMNDDEFRALMRERVSKSPEVLAFRPRLWDEFSSSLHYVPADFHNAAAYHRIAERLQEINAEQRGDGNLLLYLATAPSLFVPIVEHLAAENLIERRAAVTPWARLVVEKPFGHD